MNNMFCIHFGFLLAFHLPKSSLKLNSVGFAVRSVGSVLFLFLFGFLLFRITTITLNKIELLTITRRVSFVFVVVVVVVVVVGSGGASIFFDFLEFRCLVFCIFVFCVWDLRFTSLR